MGMILSARVLDSRGRVVRPSNAKVIVWSKADWATITPVMQSGVDAQVSSEVSPDGVPFAPHSPATMDRYFYTLNPVLRRTGRMLDTVEHVHLKRSARLRWRGAVTSRGNAVATLHQSGTARMPARPIAGYSEGLADLVTAETEATFARNVRAFGRGARDNTADALDRFDAEPDTVLGDSVGRGTVL